MAAVVLASLAFAGCDSSTSSGNGNGSSEGSNSNGGSSNGGTDGRGDVSNGSIGDVGDGAIFGAWFLGSVTGGYYDSSGNYQGVSGIGDIDSFNADGTFVMVVVSTLTTYRYELARSGRYRIKGDTIECYSVTFEDRKDGKVTTPKQSYPDFSFQFRLGKDEQGDFFMQNFNTDGTREPITDDSPKWRRSK